TMEDNVDGEVGSQDVLTDIARGVRVVERLADPFLCEGHLASDVQEDLGAADGVGGDERTFDELMWIAFHEDAVLVGTGFGFVTVDDEIAGPDTGWAEAPFDTGGKTSAAATEQGSGSDFLDDLVGAAFQRVTQALVAPGLLIAGKGVPIVEVPAGRDHLGGVRDGHDVSSS